MSLSSDEIALLVPELGKKTAGLRIRKIVQADADTFHLCFPGRSSLLISTHARASRIHTAEAIPARVPCRDFCRLLRKHLTGGVVQNIVQLDADRVVDVLIDCRQARFHLVAELLGQAADILLLDDEHRVVGRLKTGGGWDRRVAPGECYGPPRAKTAHPRMPPCRFQLGEADLDARIRAYYEAWIRSSEQEQVRVQLVRQGSRALKRLRRLEDRLARDREQAETRTVHGRWADLILAHLAQLPRRAASVTVPDLFGQLDQIEIPLDPALSVKDNAARYYKSCRRATRTLEATAKRLGEVEDRAARVEDFLLRAKSAGYEDLESLENEASRLGLLSEAVKPPGRPAEGRLPYRTFGSLTGRVILVGRSARDNHHLTFHVARGRDLWLHVSEGSGPHVIVRLEKSQPIDQETLLDAATLAVHFSSSRGAKAAEVRYALRKHVRPVRGAPGRVTVAGGKTVTVRMDANRLKRLMGRVWGA